VGVWAIATVQCHLDTPVALDSSSIAKDTSKSRHRRTSKASGRWRMRTRESPAGDAPSAAKLMKYAESGDPVCQVLSSRAPNRFQLRILSVVGCLNQTHRLC
jgi:hypothetical protein